MLIEALKTSFVMWIGGKIKCGIYDRANIGIMQLKYFVVKALSNAYGRE